MLELSADKVNALKYEPLIKAEDSSASLPPIQDQQKDSFNLPQRMKISNPPKMRRRPQFNPPSLDIDIQKFKS